MSYEGDGFLVDIESNVIYWSLRGVLVLLFADELAVRNMWLCSFWVSRADTQQREHRLY